MRRCPSTCSPEIEIERPRDRVAAYAADPTNATAWYENIERAEWKTPPPIARVQALA